MDNQFSKEIESQLENVDLFSPGFFHANVIADYVGEFKNVVEQHGFWCRYKHWAEPEEADTPFQTKVTGKLVVDWPGSGFERDSAPALRIEIDRHNLTIEKRPPGVESSTTDKNFTEIVETAKASKGRDELKESLRNAFDEMAKEIGQEAQTES